VLRDGLALQARRGQSRPLQPSDDVDGAWGHGRDSALPRTIDREARDPRRVGQRGRTGQRCAKDHAPSNLTVPHCPDHVASQRRFLAEARECRRRGGQSYQLITRLAIRSIESRSEHAGGSEQHAGTDPSHEDCPSNASAIASSLFTRGQKIEPAPRLEGRSDLQHPESRLARSAEDGLHQEFRYGGRHHGSIRPPPRTAPTGIEHQRVAISSEQARGLVLDQAG
jgi:hypothetical protein